MCPTTVRRHFHYQAGQFLTLRVNVDGQELPSLLLDVIGSPSRTDLRITVKRDRGRRGVELAQRQRGRGRADHAAPPEGRFVLRDDTDHRRARRIRRRQRDHAGLLADPYGCWPDSGRRIRLFYANRGRDSVIFADALAELAEPARVTGSSSQHHFDDDSGVVTAGSDRIASSPTAGRRGLLHLRARAVHGHRREDASLAAGCTERASASGALHGRAGAGRDGRGVAGVDRRGHHRTGPQDHGHAYRAGNTLLQTARMAGLQAPSSCETGSCGTCMARVVEGSARMLNNDALEEDEVAEGLGADLSVPADQSARSGWSMNRRSRTQW